MKKKYSALSHLKILSLRGPRAAELLQGQTTANILKLKDGESTLAAQCNRKGQVISLFFVIKQPEQFFLVLPVGMIELTINALKPYARLTKVEMQHEKELNCVGLMGEDALDGALGEIALPSKRRKILILKGPQAGIRAPEEMPDDTTLWRQYDFDENLPTLYPETSEKFTPEELNLIELGAVSFDKGCYTGQEIVARMHYLGNKAKRLIKARVSNAHAKPGDTLFPQGAIVDTLNLNNNEQYLLFTRKNDTDTFLDQQQTIKLEEEK